MATLLRLEVTQKEDVLLTGFPACRGEIIVMLYADGSTGGALKDA